jgi:cytochrome oxidase Cu insertion factor (SCO1/SenC/PrrC family)
MRGLRGKVVLVTFLDSQCTESCPIVASEIGRGLDLLEPEERRRVVALALSTDPEEDTKRSVRTFLAHNRATDKLRYLVAPEADMRPVWKAFNVLASAQTGVDELHSAPVRIFDRSGFWVTTLHAGADLTAANLAHDVRVALGS